MLNYLPEMKYNLKKTLYEKNMFYFTVLKKKIILIYNHGKMNVLHKYHKNMRDFGKENAIL